MTDRITYWEDGDVVRRVAGRYNHMTVGDEGVVLNAHANEVSPWGIGHSRGNFVLVRRAGEDKPATAGEHDPTGKDQHASGAKLDGGKLRPGLVLDGFAWALKAVVKVGTDGANKYTDNGWREVDNGFARYGEAKGRHALAWACGERRDKDTQSLHLAHEAWNALARLELYLANNPQDRA